MDKPRIIVAAADKKFCSAFKECAESADDMEVVYTTGNGTNAIKMLQRRRPEVFVINNDLSAPDSLEVLSRLKALDLFPRPKIMMVSDCIADSFSKKVHDLNVGLLASETIGIDNIVCRVRILLKNRIRDVRRINLKSLIACELNAIGVPSHIKGYDYLIDAVSLAILNHDILKSVITKMYPQIAEKHGTSPGSVERDIRHAVGNTWKCADDEIIEKFAVDETRKKPANGKFIAALADAVGERMPPR